MRIVVIVATLLALAAAAPAADDDTPESAAARQTKVLIAKADMLAVKQDWDAAESYYREAIALTPDAAAAWSGLGRTFMRQQRFSDALPALEEALRLQPNHPPTLEWLGEAYVGLGRPDDAQAVLERLRPLDAPLAATLAYVIRTGAGRW
jgi:tetratricopeptide (TPR) repeat protein